MKKPYMLIIRDGWGYNPSEKYNAIAQCRPRFHDHYIKDYPVTFIGASGSAVGLPDGYQGSSEVGHLNMGAGRVVARAATGPRPPRRWVRPSKTPLRSRLPLPVFALTRGERYRF